MHKVIHLVVGTFEKGGEVSEVEELSFTNRTQPGASDQLFTVKCLAR